MWVSGCWSERGKWRRDVVDVIARLVAALEPDDVVIGGGNVKLLKESRKLSDVRPSDNQPYDRVC